MTTYEIRHIAEVGKIPADRFENFLEDLRAAHPMLRKYYEIEQKSGLTLPFGLGRLPRLRVKPGPFRWHDDGHFGGPIREIVTESQGGIRVAAGNTPEGR